MSAAWDETASILAAQAALPKKVRKAARKKAPPPELAEEISWTEVEEESIGLLLVSRREKE